MALFRMGQILREEESHSQSSVQSLSMPINKSNELDDALSIWIIYITSLIAYNLQVSLLPE